MKKRLVAGICLLLAMVLLSPAAFRSVFQAAKGIC